MKRTAIFFVLATLALLPLVLLLVLSLGGEWFWPALVPPELETASWEAVVQGEGMGRRLRRAGMNSIILAAGTGFLAAGLAVPIGRALAGLHGWRRSFAAGAAFLPVAAPPIALAVGLQYTFLRLGLAGQLEGVLLAHLIPALGYTSLFFLGVFSLFDYRIEDEARVLGATRLQTLVRVTLPLLRRPMIEAFVLGFLVSWAQVPLTLLIGQGLVSTLAVEVLSLVQAGQDRAGATGAVLLVIPPLLTMALAGVAIRRAEAVPV